MESKATGCAGSHIGPKESVVSVCQLLVSHVTKTLFISILPWSITETLAADDQGLDAIKGSLVVVVPCGDIFACFLSSQQGKDDSMIHKFRKVPCNILYKAQE